MSNRKLLVGIYNDDHVLLDAVKTLRGKHFKIDNVYTPFPVHGLDRVLGYRESRLPTVAFIFGALGTVLALLMQLYMYSIDWQINVAGKPIVPLPSFIPITFELTVLLASLGMVGAYLVRNKLYPGKEGKVIDPRQTDDRFVVVIEASDDDSENAEIRQTYEATGAVDVREQEDPQAEPVTA
jgi:hypothetical protein